MTGSLATVAYLGATILFILSLGGLSNPEASRRGKPAESAPHVAHAADAKRDHAAR